MLLSRQQLLLQTLWQSNLPAPLNKAQSWDSIVSKLRDIFENVAAGSTGAASIAGARGAMFVTSRPVPAMGVVTMSPYAPKSSKKKKAKKIKVSKITESDNIDSVTTSSLKDLLRQKQRDSELRDTTEVLALEDSDGAVVKVYVKKDQAEDFKAAVQSSIADAEEDGKELAEVLFDLHKDFDIVSVDWGKGSIPEDEEQTDDVENSTDAEDKGFPDADELGDVEADDQSNPDDVSSDADADMGLDDMDAGGDLDAPDTAGAGDQQQLLNQILTLLTAQASAQHAKAEADKAEADVRAAEAAARAATNYASHQEEVMDMENYNKRAQEEKRENQIQAKLIRYRHDLRKDDSESLDDKLNDPEYLLNTLHKASIGESVKYHPATPEEQEVLHMEDWEEDQKKKKEHMTLRDRLNRFRHERKKGASKSDSASTTQATNEDVDSPKAFDPKTGSLMDYILQQDQLKAAQTSNAANQ